MPSFSFILGLAVTSAILGRTAAERRNRHVALWGVICFCFPIALFIIWSMDRLPPRQVLPPTVTGTASQNLPVS